MACNGCHWLVTALRCCGFKIKGKQIEDLECTQTALDKVIVIDESANEDFSTQIAMPAEECHPSLNVTSFSWPDITERNHIGGIMDDTSSEKRLICKKRPLNDQHPRPPRLLSDSNINAHLSTNPVTRFTDPIGDGVYKNVSDCQTAGDGFYQNVSECQTAEEPKILLVETSNIETKPGEGKAEKAMEPDGGDFDASDKSSAQQHSKKVPPPEISELTKLTPSGFQSRDSQKDPILVYQVLVDEMNANFGVGPKDDPSDVEMTDMTDQNSNDVDMEDLSQEPRDGGSFPCGPTPQIPTVTAGIQQEPGGGAETVIFQQPQCINLIGSVTYITNPSGTANSVKVSDKMPNHSEEGSEESLPPAKTVKSGSHKVRLQSIIWNETVKVIYFSPRRKLRKTASSKEGRQDLIAMDVWPLKDATGCNLHTRFAEVEARILTGDLHPTGLKAALGDIPAPKENSDGEDSSDGSKASSASSSNSD